MLLFNCMEQILFNYHVVQKLSQSSPKSVSKLSGSFVKIASKFCQSCDKIVLNLFHSCVKVMLKMSQSLCKIVSKLLASCLKVFSMLCQSCGKNVPKFSQSCPKVVFKLCPICSKWCLIWMIVRDGSSSSCLAELKISHSNRILAVNICTRLFVSAKQVIWNLLQSKNYLPYCCSIALRSANGLWVKGGPWIKRWQK